MSVEILVNRSGDSACLFCNTSDWSFGPIFRERGSLDAEQLAEAFQRYLPRDPREYQQSRLEERYLMFCREFDADESRFVCPCGEPSHKNLQDERGRRYCSRSCLESAAEEAELRRLGAV